MGSSSGGTASTGALPPEGAERSWTLDSGFPGGGFVSLDLGEAVRWLFHSAFLTPEGPETPFLVVPPDFMENILSHGKGAAFFPHISQGMLGPYQQLHVNITGCANMWGEYWDKLICTVRACWWGMAWGSGNLTLALTCRLSLLQHLAPSPSNQK